MQPAPPRPAFPAALITPQLPLYGTHERSPIPPHTSQPPYPENCCEQVRLLPHLLQICINGKYAGNTKFKVAVCQSNVD